MSSWVKIWKILTYLRNDMLNTMLQEMEPIILQMNPNESYWQRHFSSSPVGDVHQSFPTGEPYRHFAPSGPSSSAPPVSSENMEEVLDFNPASSDSRSGGAENESNPSRLPYSPFDPENLASSPSPISPDQNDEEARSIS